MEQREVNAAKLLVPMALAAVIAVGCRPSVAQVQPAAVAVLDGESSLNSTEAMPEADTAPTEAEGGFKFPGDSGGKLLERSLTPGRTRTVSELDRRSEPLARRRPPAVDDPEVPLPLPFLEPPRLSIARGKPIRPRPIAESRMLDSFRPEPEAPKRIELPPTVLLRQPAPDAGAVPALPIQARHQFDRAGLDDPTTDFSAQQAIAASMPIRSSPAGFMRFALPEPLQFRGPAAEPAFEIMAPVVRPLR